jgi:predicted permease
VPVLQATRPDVVHELKGEALGLHKFGLRKLLIVGQTAVSLLLMVLAGLLVRGLHHTSSIDPGFDPEGVYIMSLDLSRYGYSEVDGKSLYDRLMLRVEGLPGVTSAALANRLPLGLQHSSTGVNVPGVPPPPDDRYHPADQASVSRNYFRTMGIPLLRGRSFDERDAEGTAAVAVVNEAFALRFWPDGEAVGRTFYEGTVETGDPIRIVGVTRQGKYRSLDEEPRLYIYRPFDQRYRDDMTLHVRIQGEPGPVLQGIRDEVRNLGSDLALFRVMPLTRYIRAPTLPHRLAAWLAGTLGVIGLLLVSVGIYGLISYSVARQRFEMGIRMALGARPGQILGMVLRQGLVLSVTGAAIGTALAFPLSRSLSSFLFGLDAVDPLTYLGVTALLVAVSLLTTLLPARSAALQNPARTLRDQ